MNKGEKDRLGDGVRDKKKTDRFTEDQQCELLRVEVEMSKKKKKLRRDMSKTMKGQLRAEPKW